MTISNTGNRVTYQGNGLSTVFNYTFQVFNEDHIRVVSFDGSTETTLVKNIDFTVEGVRNTSGGTVTLTTAPPIGTSIILIRQLPLVQETDIRNQGPFFAEIHEDEYDRQIMIDQQLSESVGRAVRVTIPARDAGFNPLLPFDITSNPSSVIATNPTSNGLVMGPNIATIEGASTQAAAAAASAADAQNSANTANNIASTVAVTAAASAASASAASTSATQAANSAALAQSVIGSVAYSETKFISADTTIPSATSGCLFVVDASAGPVTLTLPLISSVSLDPNNFNVAIKKNDASINAVTIVTSGTDTIDQSVTTESLRQQDSGLIAIADDETAPDTWTSIKTGLQTGDALVSEFDGTGSQLVYTLPASGTPNSVDVYISGVHQAPSNYSVAGMTLTFSTAPAAGTGNIVIKQQILLEIGEPSTGTVQVSSLNPTASTVTTSPTKIVLTNLQGILDTSLIPGAAQFPTQAAATAAGYNQDGLSFYNTTAKNHQTWLEDPAGDGSIPSRYHARSIMKPHLIAISNDGPVIPHNMRTDLNYNIIANDNFGALNQNNGVYQVRDTGLYTVIGHVSLSMFSGPGSHLVEASIMVNGGSNYTMFGNQYNATKYVTSAATSIVAFTRRFLAGDFIRLQILHISTQGNPLALTNGGFRNFLTISKVD